MKPWTYGNVLSSVSLKLFEAEIIEAIHPNTGITVPVVRLKGRHSCNALVFNEHLDICLVQQFRFGTNTMEWELPGGLIEEDESPEQAVAREIMEETGLICRDITPIGRIPSNPVFMDHFVYHFAAQTHTRTQSKTHQDDGEWIHMKWFSAKEVFQLVKEGQVRHPHTLSALFYVSLHENYFEKSLLNLGNSFKAQSNSNT
jgi:8-oxo-dGTP pyrophosphatase MutT (NUDIX family)